jgi:hypothetical protein
MVNIQSLVVIGVIVAGAAIALSLFALYPDMMFKNTGLDPNRESGGAYGGDMGTQTPTGSPQASAP